jgi:hypothetical protein
MTSKYIAYRTKILSWNRLNSQSIHPGTAMDSSHLDGTHNSACTPGGNIFRAHARQERWVGSEAEVAEQRPSEASRARSVRPELRYVKRTLAKLNSTSTIASIRTRTIFGSSQLNCERNTALICAKRLESLSANCSFPNFFASPIAV